MTTTTLGEALQGAGKRVDATDARVLLCHVTGRDAGYVIAHPEAALAPAEAERFDALVQKREQGEPVAYLTGEREFYGRVFKVTPAVLIPRPETELLVDHALERIPQNGPARVLDVGTGSGCIVISLASERPQAKFLAIDRSTEALAVARRNAVAANIGNVAFLNSDMFLALKQEHFDVIVANPPYVATKDPHMSQGDLRFEPKTALDGGADGFAAIDRLIVEARNFLNPGGWLVFEHGHDHGERARLTLHKNGYDNIYTARDLSRIDRVSAGRLTSALSLA